MAKEVIITADKIRNRERHSRFLKLSVFLLLLLLIIVYIVLRVTYSEGSFVVTLKDNESLEAGLAIYESPFDRTAKRWLKAESLQFMDNISIKWLPEDIDSDKWEGTHNGDNYIAYTFYVENQSSDVFDYWYEMILEDVIKDVDEAARIIIYINGESTIYAKGSSITGEAEEGTTKFRNDKDGTIILGERQGLNPGEIDRVTVVVFIEGDDPECVDALIGGEMKMHMNITEEHIKLK